MCFDGFDRVAYANEKKKLLYNLKAWTGFIEHLYKSVRTLGFFFRLSCSAVALATQALHLKFIKLSRFVRTHQGHHNKCANIEYMLLISNSLVFPWIEFTGVSMNYVFSIFQLIIITGPFNWCDDFGDVEKKNWQLHSLLYRAVCACADLI